MKMNEKKAVQKILLRLKNKFDKLHKNMLINLGKSEKNSELNKGYFYGSLTAQLFIEELEEEIKKIKQCK